MAYHFFTIDKTSQRLRRGYNVDFAVGQGGRNRTEDLMLLQTLLRLLYVENTSPAMRAMFPPTGDDVVVDGKFGPVTHRYVLRFKNQMRALGTVLYPDAVMDPFRDNDPFSVSKNSRTEYAFGLLLRAAARADEESNLRRFDDLVQLEETHPTLKIALRQSRDDALQYS
jgi:hypothetical protein